jgi:hypothetical protein
MASLSRMRTRIRGCIGGRSLPPFVRFYLSEWDAKALALVPVLPDNVIRNFRTLEMI